MKSIEGRASAVGASAMEDCFALLAAVDRYTCWNGELVREVEVLERDGEGHPARARMMIHVAQSPLAKDFEFSVAVRGEPLTVVSLTRLADKPSDRERLVIGWRLEPVDGTRIELAFRAATALLPSF